MQTPTTVGPIWTINARESVALESTRRYFYMSDRQLHAQVGALHLQTIDILRSKEVDYQSLRNALTPSRNKHEAAFLFDSASPEMGLFYGMTAGSLVLRALPTKDFTTSLLSGDLLIEDQALGFALLETSIVPRRRLDGIRHTSQVYGIYINNLTLGRLEQIDRELSKSAAYLGHVPCTYASPVKTWLSTTLAHRYVKCDRVFLSCHEPDVSNTENYNLPSWPLENYGYRAASLQDIYFDIFLSYKIEREPTPGDTDVRHALSAISEHPLDLAEFSVEISDSKLAYIKQHKGGILRSPGLHQSTRESLEDAIRLRVAANYIYGLELLPPEKESAAKFSVMLEFEGESSPIRIQATVAYEPGRHALRVITLY